MFFTSFIDSDASGSLDFQDSWFVPNHSQYFNILDDHEVQVQPGIYEISFSCLIEQADDTHGATVYLSDSAGSAVKDFSYKLSPGTGTQMNFSQSVLFRFEEVTNLQVISNILGDEGTSNVIVSGVNLLIKKIHE